MYNIAVIGAGQLGRRHLQGLAQSKLDASLHIVDPSKNSLEAARTCLTEVPPQHLLNKSFHPHVSAEKLPNNLDLVIIATTADVRLDALRDLCNFAPPRYLILEKVLFQRLSDYPAAAQLIREHGITTWVNCPRRAFSIYQNLRDFFADDPVRYMDVYGGDWGMGCNSIHFLDLLASLGGAGPLSVLTSNLASGVMQSKRAGFVEFSGALSGRLGDAEFSLRSIVGSSKKHLITLHSEQSKSVFIDEARGELWKHSGSDAVLERFTLLYQSQLSGLLAESILNSGDCPLTPYAESMALHIPLLQALGRHATDSALDTDFCPIT